MKRSSVDGHVLKRLGLPTTAARPELEHAQLNLLRRTIRHAMANCSFYSKRYGDFDPDTIRTHTDLQKIPLIDNDDIHRNGHEMLCISQSRVARVITMHTSGSTGSPKRLFFSRKDLQATTEFFHAGMRSLISLNDRVLVLLPWQQPASVGDLLIQALNQHHVFAAGMWPPDFSGKGSRYIHATNFNCIVGLPQHLLALSFSLEKDRIQSMLLCSDYAPPALRRQIEENSGCTTFLHYGSTESGLGGGVECSLHDGCHLRDSDVLMEVIDPLTGEQQPAMVTGELVLTTLGREAMPLIRYRTGDWGMFDHSTCPCGAITTRLHSITGRMQSCQLSSGGLLCCNELDDLLYTQPGLLDYRAILGSSGDGDKLDIFYTAHSTFRKMEPLISSLLLCHPILKEAVRKNKLQIDEIHEVETFGTDHTLKRTISDRRKE